MKKTDFSISVDPNKTSITTRNCEAKLKSLTLHRHKDGTVTISGIKRNGLVPNGRLRVSLDELFELVETTYQYVCYEE